MDLAAHIKTMQPTEQELWSLYRRVRGGQVPPWPPELVGPYSRIVYTYDREGHIRLKSVLGPKRTAVTPAVGPWLHVRYPLDTAPWRLPVPDIPELKQGYETGSPGAGAGAGAGGPGSPGGGWAVARGWAVGALLLALLALLVRAADKWIDRRLDRWRRRQSEEWPTPSVLATIHQDSAVAEAGEGAGSGRGPPPPYAACTGKPCEQPPPPPPPYSACCPGAPQLKDEPEVHALTSGHDDEAHCNRDVPNDVDNNTELVFENGNIVERNEAVDTDGPDDVTDPNPSIADDAARNKVVFV